MGSFQGIVAAVSQLQNIVSILVQACRGKAGVPKQ
jgi:hypothetical protein